MQPSCISLCRAHKKILNELVVLGTCEICEWKEWKDAVVIMAVVVVIASAVEVTVKAMEEG